MSNVQRRHHLMSLRSTLLACLTIVTVAASAPARQIDVPLRFDHELIRQALFAQLYTSASGKAILWDNGTGCGYLKLREPTVSTVGSRLRIETRGEARIGTPVGTQCIAPLQWDGFVDAFEEPVVSDDQQTLQFRVVESHVYDSHHQKRFFTGMVWDIVKQYVHPTFESVHVDISNSALDLRELLPLVLVHNDAERIARVVDSLRLVNATTTDTGVAVTVTFTVDPQRAGGAPTPEPTLTPEELQRWEAAWQRWDAFLTFVIKHIWGDTLVSELRQPLTDVLLAARFDILDALTPPAPGAPDPTPALFVKTWERLAPVVRRSASHLPGATALRYLSFIAAGDALVALNQAGPDIGLDISADGLRRLARMVAPHTVDDPLIYDTAVDPQLRQLFQFGPPLPPPDLSGEPPDEVWWRRWIHPREAWAGDEVTAPEALRRWIADREAIDPYLQSVREVLESATKGTLEASDLGKQYRDLYEHLVLATAWQESCWRQFVLEGGRVTYLKSGVGASGMMQVNEKVWRGIYDLRGLRWDIKYNARAGAEIVMRYLSDYAIARVAHTPPAGLDNLARATYAVYNGGPGQLARYRKKDTRATLKRIDKLFWEKYDAVSKGHAMDVAKCFGGG